MASTLIGIFSNRLEAENAISDLQVHGFDPQDISIIMRDRAEAERLAHNSGAHVAEGAVSGIATGSLIGGIAGLLVGIGAISVPGVGALLIGGPIAVALGLTGAAATTLSGAVTGALAGGLVGALVGLGVPEYDAKRMESRIKDGGILVAIPVLAGEEIKGREILQKYHADMVRLIGSHRQQEEVQPVYPQNTYQPEQTYQDPVYYSDIRTTPKVRDEYYKEDIPEDLEMHKDTLKEKLKKLFR